MANHITSGTTVGGVVTTVTFATWYHNIEVLNRSTGDMWIRVDGVDPTVAGDDCFFVPALGFVDVVNPSNPPVGTPGTTSVKMISAANATYTVQVGV